VFVEVNLNDVAVVHNEKAHRFEMELDGLRPILTYRRFPDRIHFIHTEVPPPLEGRGLAGKLVRTALDFARANHLRVVPVCPYVASFLRKHPEYQDLVSADDLQRILSRSTRTANE
jgi:predicted GNAT family acetyltransferase